MQKLTILCILSLVCILAADHNPLFLLDKSVGGKIIPFPLKRENIKMTWSDKNDYYYTQVVTRIKAILTPSCHHNIKIINGNWNDEVSYFNNESQISEPLVGDNVKPMSSTDMMIHVLTIKVSEDIQQFWFRIPPPSQMRSDMSMCNATWSNKKSIFKVVHRMCKEVLHQAAPRCQGSYLEWACYYSMSQLENTASNHFYLPEANHVTSAAPPEPYLMRIRDAYVSGCGEVSLHCGVMIPVTMCDRLKMASEGKSFARMCGFTAEHRAHQANMSVWDRHSVNMSVWDRHSVNVNTSTCLKVKNPRFEREVHHYDRVFVVSQPDDSHIYHVQLEVLPKIAYHLEFLLQNPDIKILIGCDLLKPMRPESRRKAKRFQKIGLRPVLKLLGLPIERFIFQKTVLAREVFVPSESACQDPVHNTWQVLTMRHMVLARLGLPSGVHTFEEAGRVLKEVEGSEKASTDDDNQRVKSSTGVKRPLMLLIKRSKHSTSTRQRKDGFRQWSESFTATIMVLLQEACPGYDVKLYSDMDTELMSNYAEQVKLFNEADVVIGVHGAGLGHMLYMKPNRVVVEIAPAVNDGRMHLGGGPFNRLATLLSHNYLVHMPTQDELVYKLREIEFDAQSLVTHIKSFLVSLGRI